MTLFEAIAAAIWGLGMITHWRMWRIGALHAAGPHALGRKLLIVAGIVGWPLIYTLFEVTIMVAEAQADRDDDEFY